MVGVDVQGLADWIGRAGALGVIVFVLVALYQRWLLLPRELDTVNAIWEERMREMTQDRNEWKERALTAAQLAQRSASAAMPVVVAEAGMS